MIEEDISLEFGSATVLQMMVEQLVRQNWLVNDHPTTTRTAMDRQIDFEVLDYAAVNQLISVQLASQFSTTFDLVGHGTLARATKCEAGTKILISGGSVDVSRCVPTYKAMSLKRKSSISSEPIAVTSNTTPTTMEHPWIVRNNSFRRLARALHNLQNEVNDEDSHLGDETIRSAGFVLDAVRVRGLEPPVLEWNPNDTVVFLWARVDQIDAITVSGTEVCLLVGGKYDPEQVCAHANVPKEVAALLAAFPNA